MIRSRRLFLSAALGALGTVFANVVGGLTRLPVCFQTLAVLDRFETLADGTLVGILVPDESADAVGQLIVEQDELPPDARAEGAVVELTFVGDRLLAVYHRPGLTERRGQRTENRFSDLARQVPKEGNDTFVRD